MITINGRQYPLWSQFVEQKERWVGGILEELDSHDPMDIAFGCDKGGKTRIEDVRLVPNGKESAVFEVVGEDFSCGFDVRTGGIDGSIGGEGWIGFCRYGGHRWRIRERENEETAEDRGSALRGRG